MKKNKTEILSNAPISKALLALGVPTMIGMMVNALYNIVDSYFVAGLGTSQNGAIAVAFPLGQIVVGIGLLFGTGAGSYLSRLLGRKEKDTASVVASTAVYMSIIAGALIITITMVFLQPILRCFGATDSIMPYALSYTGIYIVSSIFNIFNVTMNNIVTSEGASKITMFALLAGALLNVVLDPIFIYTLKLNIAGAAIATAISQIISTLIYVYYICSKKSNFNFNPKNFSPTKNILSEIFKIGIPTLIFQLLTSISIALVSGIANHNGYGDSIIAGMGNVTRIISMGSLIVFGFIKGFQPIAGYNYGAKKYDRLQESIKISIVWSSIFCAVFGLCIAFFSTSIISQFTKNDVELITIGSKALIANGISFILFGFYTVYSSLFLALGKAKEGFVLGACRQGICFIPIVLLLTTTFGKNGIIYAQPISDVLSALITIPMAIHLHKELKHLKSKIS